jgi:hypothetical protein
MKILIIIVIVIILNFWRTVHLEKPTMAELINILCVSRKLIIALTKACQ